MRKSGASADVPDFHFHGNGVRTAECISAAVRLFPQKAKTADAVCRSGLACKRGLAPANKVGVIDSDYRGEFIVALHNHGTESQTVASGERIAQLVVTPILMPEYVETDSLSSTQRGEGGFGSTGK